MAFGNSIAHSDCMSTLSLNALMMTRLNRWFSDAAYFIVL
jgi:hypothetical protein